MMDGHHETGCAEPALHTAGVDESLLNVAQGLIGTQAFDGRDLGVDGRRGQHEAGADRSPVENDGAAAAFTLFARAFRARKTESLSKHVEEALADPRVLDIVATSVHGERIVEGGRGGGRHVDDLSRSRRESTRTACRR